jgi:predicted transcriptional regulator YdeE
MNYKIEKKEKKFVIGIATRTSNALFQKDSAALWEKFSQEGVFEKIPNKAHPSLLAIYTNYEGDYTKPFTYLIGCEVSSLDLVPKDMIAMTIEHSSYAVVKAKGAFPDSLFQAWQSIWNSNLKRSYTFDFEVYPPDFNPQNNPEVEIFIATQD